MSHASIASLSLYKLKKYFEKHFNPAEYSLSGYCTKCHRNSERKDACISGCEGGINKFLYIPIELQLKKKLEGESDDSLCGCSKASSA